MDSVVFAEFIGPFQIVLLLIFLAVFALWIKTIVEIATSTYSDNSKTTWLLIVILIGWIGMIIYYAAGRHKRITEVDKGTDPLDNF